MPSTAFPKIPTGTSATFPSPNDAVEAARQRRVSAAVDREIRTQWFIKEATSKVAIGMRQRVSMATHFLKDRVVRNISTPVVKGVGPRGGRVVTGRSVGGEYPHADTTQLMKTIFAEVVEVQKNVFDGYVGTPLDYGLILETRMNRSFLKRTFDETEQDLRAILSGPVA